MTQEYAKLLSNCDKEIIHVRRLPASLQVLANLHSGLFVVGNMCTLLTVHKCATERVWGCACSQSTLDIHGVVAFYILHFLIGEYRMLSTPSALNFLASFSV